MNQDQTTTADAVTSSAGLGDSHRCASCGRQAAEVALSRKLKDIDATERNFIEHCSGWKGRKLVTHPSECYPLDKQGREWEVCGRCGCPRWESPSVALPAQGQCERCGGIGVCGPGIIAVCPDCKGTGRASPAEGTGRTRETARPNAKRSTAGISPRRDERQRTSGDIPCNTERLDLAKGCGCAL
jgi:hypothetical protein